MNHLLLQMESNSFVLSIMRFCDNAISSVILGGLKWMRQKICSINTFIYLHIYFHQHPVIQHRNISVTAK